jgi:hypothetical protein
VITQFLFEPLGAHCCIISLAFSSPCAYVCKGAKAQSCWHFLFNFFEFMIFETHLIIITLAFNYNYLNKSDSWNLLS